MIHTHDPHIVGTGSVGHNTKYVFPKGVCHKPHKRYPFMVYWIIIFAVLQPILFFLNRAWRRACQIRENRIKIYKDITPGTPIVFLTPLDSTSCMFTFEKNHHTVIVEDPEGFAQENGQILRYIPTAGDYFVRLAQYPYYNAPEWVHEAWNGTAGCRESTMALMHCVKQCVYVDKNVVKMIGKMVWETRKHHALLWRRRKI